MGEDEEKVADSEGRDDAVEATVDDGLEEVASPVDGEDRERMGRRGGRGEEGREGDEEAGEKRACFLCFSLALPWAASCT